MAIVSQLWEIAQPFSLVILAFALWGVYQVGVVIVQRLRLRNPKSELISEAPIITKLVPRIDPFVRLGSLLYIIGNDGTYIRKSRGLKWLAQLEAWVKRGCTISYVLTNADVRSLGLLRSLHDRYPSKFLLYAPVLNDSLPSELCKLAKQYETFHPILLENLDGTRAMWIEHYHPKDSELAFKVEFVAPREARMDNERFELYKRDFRLFISSHSAVDELPIAEKSAPMVAA
jgi:hypothetical protein